MSTPNTSLQLAKPAGAVKFNSTWYYVQSDIGSAAFTYTNLRATALCIGWSNHCSCIVRSYEQAQQDVAPMNPPEYESFWGNVSKKCLYRSITLTALLEKSANITMECPGLALYSGQFQSWTSCWRWKRDEGPYYKSHILHHPCQLWLYACCWWCCLRYSHRYGRPGVHWESPPNHPIHR